MRPQGESIWGNINLCIEIAFNIYYICADKGAGVVIPKDYASEFFSEKTMAAGKESDGYLYYGEKESMDLPMYEIMQKRASRARKVQAEAARQMQIISEGGQLQETDYLADIAAPDHGQMIQNGIYLVEGEPVGIAVQEQVAEYFMTVYACEFGRHEGGYLYYDSASSAIPLYELQQVFPEVKKMIVSEESLYATLCQQYPVYREWYNQLVEEGDQIPHTDTPVCLFLKEQLEVEKKRQEQAVGEGQAFCLDFGENEEDAYGEQVEYGLEA
ncbi:MAG: hypothetical protein HDR14_13905 [Lachnospiraceae bacterium]|nr:hypothetical protein [Lachnospiraceae bacterium]